MVKGCSGFSIPELLISMSILVFLMLAVFTVLSTSQAAYFNADAGIQLRTIFRNAGQKIAWEMGHTGFDAVNGAQFAITAGAGYAGSDIVRFSVPVACDATTSFLNTTGNPNRWGANLTWGCETVACADTDANCATVEYKYIQYELNSSGQVVRKVLDNAQTVVATVVIADKITAFNVVASGTSGMTFSMTGQMRSDSGRMVTDSISQTVRFMN